MPEIKPIKILTFSSEDDFYPVKNLLKGSSLFQWKCKTRSEIEAFAEFKFENLTRFTRIEIGNQSSAFIEIKVSRSLDNKDYQVLLGLTSLMSPSEALRCENLNRVKYFNDVNFAKEISSEKWDIIKVVLTQPFNKTLQYGLSFIKFFGEINSINRLEDKGSPMNQQKIDISKLLEAPFNEDEFKPGSLFINRNKTDESQKLTDIKMKLLNKNSLPESVLTKQIGQAYSSVIPKKVEKKKIKPLSSESASEQIVTKLNQNNTSKIDKSTYNINTDKSSSLLTRKRPNRDSVDNLSNQNKKVKFDSMPNSNTGIKSSSNDTSSCNSSVRKWETISNPTNSYNTIQESVSNNIFKDVVFVLSGYQNPLRNDLRDKAISLGAKYRNSWTDDSTHLICAFNNTPKFKEVCGKGIIVSEKWILECYNHKKLLPWQDFRLKGATSPPSSKKFKSNSDSSVRNNISQCSNLKNAPSTSKNTSVSLDSLPQLPEIFESMNFFFYGNFERDNLRFLKRLIVTFGGVIHEYMNTAVKIVITDSFWDDNFDEAMEANQNIKFVKSSWLNACDEQHSVIPFEDFEIKKK